jgi:hypothetical protein
MMDASFTTSSYFQTQEPPRNLAEEQARTAAFLQRAKAQGKRVVLVTVSAERAALALERPAMDRPSACAASLTSS